MRIAINTRMLLADRLEGIGWYTYHLMSRLTRSHPDHEFLFFFDRPYDSRFLVSDNVKPIVLPPPARHPLLWYWWFEYAVRHALAHHGADVFFSPDGFLSLRAPTPAVLAIHDLAFERFCGHLSWLQRWYCARFTPAFVRKASTVVAVSEFSKQELVDCYGVETDKVTVIPCAAGTAFRPRPKENTPPLVASLTGGEPYFLHVGAIHPRKNVANLLRGFEQFKTDSRSTAKLLVAGRLAWKYHDVLRIHAAMRYRDDVVFLGYRPLDELAVIMASALAVVSVSLYEGFGLPGVEAMASDVAVIASNRTALAEVASDAALLVDPLDPRAIGQAMRRMEADAQLRAELIRRGRQRVGLFNWDRSAADLWCVLVAVANQATTVRGAVAATKRQP